MRRKLHASLFLKIASILVVSLIATNLLTAALTAEVTKRLFVDSFTLLNDEIMQRVTQNLADYNTQTVSIFNTYRQNMPLKECMTERITDQRRLFKLYYDMKSYMKSAESTSIFPTYNTVTLGINGEVFLGNGGLPIYDGETYRRMPLARLSREHPGRLFYRYSPSGLTLAQKDRNSIIAAMQLTPPYGGYSFGTLFITIDESAFYNLYVSCVTKGSEVLALSADGTVVSGSNKALIGSVDTELLAQSAACVDSGERFTDVTHGGRPYALIAKYLPDYDMYLANLVDKEAMLGDFIRMRPFLIGSCAAVIAIAVCLAFYVARRMTTPITALITRMSENRWGKFAPLKEITGSYEVRELQHGYNEMVDELGRYIDQLVEEQTQRRRSDIALLQSQINPHFLYNTLASIKYLSWQGDKDAVAETINALIRLLQGVMGPLDETIPVSEELENLKSYVTINHMRYGDGIKVYYNADPDCLSCRIPKLILQPFIENSFFHAFQIKREGSIHIFIKGKGDHLICEIIDDGDGMAQADLRSLSGVGDKSRFSGVGIRNVEERLRLIYGADCGVRLSSEPGVGTTVTITLRRLSGDR